MNSRCDNKLLAVVVLILLACTRSLDASQRWRFIPVTIDGNKDTVVHDFALGADGVPWAVLSEPKGVICHWQEGRWHKIDGDFVTDVGPCRLFVSPDGQVYLSQPDRTRTSNRPRIGKVYRLEDGQAVNVTEFYCGHDGMRPKLFFDSKGRIWNWGSETLGVFDDGQWERVRAHFGSGGKLFEDSDGNVYAFGPEYASYYRDGQFTIDVELPSVARAMMTGTGCLWGTDKVLFTSFFDRKIAVLDLATMKPLDILGNEPLMSRFGPISCFRDRQGNVWVYAHIGRPGDAEERRHGQSVVWEHTYALFHGEDGSIEKIPELAYLGGRDPRQNSEPRSVMQADDGTMYFGCYETGIDIYKNGVLTHLHWREGLPLNEVDWIYENKTDGTIWFASPRSGVAVHDPRGTDGSQATSRFLDTWTAFDLASSRVLKDFKGRLWCFLKDKPGCISNWDGRQWAHFDIPFERGEVSACLVDQMGRLHVDIGQYSTCAYRIDGQNVAKFDKFRDMLVDSAQTGSRTFRSSAPVEVPPPVIVDPNEIWWCERQSNLCLYDGIQWHSFRAYRFVRPVLWPDGSVVIVTGAKHQVLERGQLVDFQNEYTATDKILIGENGAHVFDPDAYAERPDHLFLARRARDAVYVFQDMASFLASSGNEFPETATRFPHDAQWVQPADGGFWFKGFQGRLTRYWKGLSIEVDLRKTPIGKSGHRGTYEDPEGNLWLQTTHALYRVQRPVVDTVVRNNQERVCKTGQDRVEFRGTVDGEVSDDLRYSWRIDGGPWAKPSREDFADVSFKRSGFHEIEVVAITEMASFDTSPAKLIIKGELPISVEIVSAPSKTVTRRDTIIRYRMINNIEEVSAIYQWRLDGEQWHNTTEDFAELTELRNGKHCFEVRVIVDETYTQRVPARAEFEVRAAYPIHHAYPTPPVIKKRPPSRKGSR